MELQAIMAQLALLVQLARSVLSDHKEKPVPLAILDPKDPKDQLAPLENLTKPQLQLFTKLQSFTKPQLQSFTKPLPQSFTKPQPQSSTKRQLQSFTKPQLQSSMKPP